MVWVTIDGLCYYVVLGLALNILGNITLVRIKWFGVGHYTVRQFQKKYILDVDLMELGWLEEPDKIWFIFIIINVNSLA